MTTDSFNLLVVDETPFGIKENDSNFGGPNLAKIQSYANLDDPCNTSKDIKSNIEDE